MIAAKKDKNPAEKRKIAAMLAPIKTPFLVKSFDSTPGIKKEILISECLAVSLYIFDYNIQFFKKFHKIFPKFRGITVQIYCRSRF